jgi:hypothetical protein
MSSTEKSNMKWSLCETNGKPCPESLEQLRQSLAADCIFNHRHHDLAAVVSTAIRIRIIALTQGRNESVVIGGECFELLANKVIACFVARRGVWQ